MMFRYLNSHSAVNATSRLSFGTQIIVNLIEIITLFSTPPDHMTLIRQLLLMELFVQFIEWLFYAYLIFHANQKFNITPLRYIDWTITTPVMLVILVSYMIWAKNREEDNKSLDKIIAQEKKPLSVIVLLDFLMLAFGFLGEIGLIKTWVSVVLGFIPFFAYYYLIYEHYLTSDPVSVGLFIYFFVIWTLYGIAAMLPFYIKNTLYNILDLLAKNFFGLFLSFLLLTVNK